MEKKLIFNDVHHFQLRKSIFIVLFIVINNATFAFNLTAF